MYIPAHFRESDADKLAAVIEQNSFGTLVSSAAGRPFASHLPFLLDRAAGTLMCHVARANEQWRHLSDHPEVLAIFTGPHAYVSPTWYADGGVPTWNYVAVHVYGRACAIDDAAATRQHVERLAARFERGRERPWAPSYDTRMLKGIVGIEIRITEIQGKLKLGQNRSTQDRARVAAALGAGTETERALGQWIPLE